MGGTSCKILVSKFMSLRRLRPAKNRACDKHVMGFNVGPRTRFDLLHRECHALIDSLYRPNYRTSIVISLYLILSRLSFLAC